jgi:hypothetical protein
MTLKEFNEQYEYLKSVDYTEYDAMNNNPTPDEEMIKLILKFAEEYNNK